MSLFRFEVGQHVRVITHPAKPLGTIVERWTGKEMRDIYDENIYSVSSFVTKQRESSLEAVLEGDGEPGTQPSPQLARSQPSPLRLVGK
jgi:hypothetical protein